MTDRLPDVWASRDFPVLREVTRRVDEGKPARAVDIATALDMQMTDVQRAGAALLRRGLVETTGSFAGGVVWFDDVSAEAYMLTGLHPDGETAIDKLADALRQAIERTSDPEDKRALRRLKDSLLDAPAGVLGSVITAVITSGIGG